MSIVVIFHVDRRDGKLRAHWSQQAPAFPAAYTWLKLGVSSTPSAAASLVPRSGLLTEVTLRQAFPLPWDPRRGALVVCTAHDGDIWVHLGPPQMWYLVDDEEEMLKVLDLLLRDQSLFVRTVTASGTWLGTTLVRRMEDVQVQDGETATLGPNIFRHIQSC